MYNCKRQRQQRTGSHKWDFGTLPYRVTYSRPAQRRSNHGGKRIFNENKDCEGFVSHGTNENRTQNLNGTAGRRNQFFNLTPKTFCHCDNVNLHTSSEYAKQQTPLKEITMNCSRPVFKNVFQDIPKHRSCHFKNSPISVNEQQPHDLFHYNGACYQNSKSFYVSPTKFSVFSKESDSSEFSSNTCSTNDFLKFSGKNYNCLEELCRKSPESLSVCTHPQENSWGDICQHQVKLIKEEPIVGPYYPETPESSRGRISPPKSIYQRMSLLNEEFGDLSDGALQISPMQEPVKSSPRFDFSDNACPNFKSFPLQQECKTSSNFFQEQERNFRNPNMPFCQKLEPYLTDPDEEYANMRLSSAPANLLRENFHLFSS